VGNTQNVGHKKASHVVSILYRVYDTRKQSAQGCAREEIFSLVFLPTVSWDYLQIVCQFESKFGKFYSQVGNKNSQNHVHLRFVYASHMRFFAVYIEMQMKYCVIMNDQKINALITGQTVTKKSKTNVQGKLLYKDLN
jgi:hypothetical protein